MTLILCIDTRLGVSFLGKRQSRDRVLSADIVNSAGGRRILISEYSKLLFDEAKIELSENNIFVTKNPIGDSDEGDLVFLEQKPKREDLLFASELVLYCWGRHYPSDRRLDRGLIDENFELSEEREFVGNSHEKLTRYTLKRKNGG